MIHSTAIINPQAALGNGVEVGPFCIIEDVTIGANTKVRAGTIIRKGSVIGQHCDIGEYAVIGGNPQDVSFDPKTNSGVTIGDHCHIREFVTIHRATKKGASTRIGCHSMLMAYCHIAHDCYLGDHVIMVNSSQISGHVEIGNHAFLSGQSGVHQFVRIGAYVMIAAYTKLGLDAPPFSLVEGMPGRFCGLNVVGLRRNNFDPQSRKLIKEFYQQYYEQPSKEERVALLKDKELTSEQQIIYDFISQPSKRGIVFENRK